MKNDEALDCCKNLMAGCLQPLLKVKEAPIDAIFIWGRAVDEWQATEHEEGIIQLAGKLHRATRAPVAIPSYNGKDFGQGETGYPGPQLWSKALHAYKVPQESIILIPGIGHNTKTEFEDFLDLAKQNVWTRTVAISQCTHVLRAMLTALRSMQKRGMEHLVVIPTYPTPVDIKRVVHGSQGQGPYTRLAWMRLEFERIERYRKKYDDVATYKELWAYFQKIMS